MCYYYYLRWDCGDEVLTWEFCKNGDKKKRIPCKKISQSVDRNATYCCSTSCCQLDLIEQLKTVIVLERKYGIQPGEPWSTRQIQIGSKHIEDADSFALQVGRTKMVNAIGDHFRHCVRLSDTRRTRNNLVRLENSQRPEVPLELGIPNRPEVSEEDRRDFLDILHRWRQSDYIAREHATYNDWMYTLSEEQRFNERQWQQEMKWQLSNSQAVVEYARSSAVAVYRPILPAGQNPLVLAPGAPGSQFPPRREEDTTDIDISSTSSSQPSTRANTPSNSRPGSRLERAGRSLGGATFASSQSGKHSSNKRARVNTSDSDLSVEFVGQRPREKRATREET